jgi:hypothetical protein
MTFNQGRNVAVLRSCDEVAFPMPRHRPILNRRRSLTDQDHVLDLAMGTAFLGCLFGPANRALGSKVLKKLFLKHTAGLNK